MPDYTLARQDIKLPLLDLQIRAFALPGFTGLSQDAESVVAHFDQEPLQAELDALHAIVAAHDPAMLTPAEQAAQAAEIHAATLKAEWYAIITADPATIEMDLMAIQSTLAAASAALQAGDTTTGITRLLQAQISSALLGQTAMQHILVLTRVLREVMRRTSPDILTDPEQL